MKVKLAPRSASGSLLNRNVLKIAAVAAGVVFLACIALFSFYYCRYKHIVDERLEKPLFTNTAKIYAAPREVRPGQKLTANFVVQELRSAGYTEDGAMPVSPMGTYSLNSGSITIHPGPQSYHAPDSATIDFDTRTVSKITDANGQALAAYELEPLLVTGLSDQNRIKRRLVTYNELPRYLVPAVTSIEDKRFFEHSGVDYYSMIGWVWHDMRGDRRYMGGGSTLTMQLAKNFFLTPERTIRRKLIQILITFQLEHRYGKQKIFELYANEISLGQQGSFAINGFGEAAQAYFGKDVRQLNLQECALLAGLIQSPSRLNPYRHAARAMERRNVVLDAMVETGAITKDQAEEAKASPLKLTTQSVDANEAPYFVDLVRDQIVQKLGDAEYNHQGLRIYTSLDPQLQTAASDAVNEGMKLVDALVTKKHTHRATKNSPATVDSDITYPQVALIALNPHTGQVLALVGGRNYGMSQFNHAVRHRPTGSIFKPFVYAAAFNSSLSGAQLTNSDGTSSVFTPVTMLNDEQTTYTVGDQEYTPHNFHNEEYGMITARFALQESQNVATIALGQMVGFNNVAALARDAGIKSARGTPSVAIGAYDAAPLDMAGAYTVFANGGVKIDPWMLASVRSANGDVISEYSPTSKPILDPRVAYLTTSMLENVINHGTGIKVRSMGFTAPAAGKTGTSNDAWFAGYTSNLLCIVWVGNDDYSDIKLQGADAAAPIFAEFMKRAVALPQYSDTKNFEPPAGITEVQLDKATNLIADASCSTSVYTAAFLDGTQPTDTCDHTNGDQRNLFQKIFGIGQKPVGPAPVQTAQPAPQPVAPMTPAPNPAQSVVTENSADPNAQQTKKKRGFFGRLFGGKKDDQQPQQPQQQPQQQNPQ
ncbi:PBP1A family penicillin-binding protein [Acidobacterium sp. S8]|uniref:PBP1A family penicillin-binding protein n=1 Tax=Acidobacterium sp. S8 TaxID=1641854 RepID=UPI0020B1698C|nr:PBP1A family penicillin-binding protein [Acidobacterium sp. S8]